MDYTPLISIITPVFNGGNFITKCIQNVAQFKTLPIEHILCDGCSTDGTWETILQYQKTHPHIRAYQEKDTGQSNAMNKGIQKSRAAIIGFLNADDFYEPSTLKDLIAIIASEPVPTLWLGNCQVWGVDQKKLSLNKPQALNYYSLLAGYELPYNPSAYFYHKSIHDIIGFYPESDHYTMDLDFLIKAYRVAKIKYYDKTWGNFQLIPGSKTFEDSNSGHMFKRTQILKDQAILNLPLKSKIIVKYYQIKKRIIHGLKRHYESFHRYLLSQ